jgi:GNAT superfamily N-acetyltransferase
MFGTRRTLNINDLPACLALAADRGWAPEADKWRLLLSIGEGWGIDHPDGGLAGTVILTRHGARIAVISMLLVRRDCGGQGIAQGLMRFIINRARNTTTYLYSTEEAYRLYAKLGFVTVDHLVTHRGRLAATDPRQGSGSRPFVKKDLPAVIAVDQAAFGAERSGLINGLIALAERVRVTEQNGHITGYGIAWKNLDTIHLGPIIAPDNETALRLIVDLAREQKLAVRLDLSRRHKALSTWAKEQGLVAGKETPMMVFKTQNIPGNRACLYSIAMQATG